jgi:hypothetical protein
MKGIVMKQDFDELHYFAGYPDKDSMREKAKRLMLEEMMGTSMSLPGSITEPGREKMRLYKKGGKVKHHKHYRQEHDHDMHEGGEAHAYEHEEIHPFHGQEARHHESHRVHYPHAYTHIPEHEFNEHSHEHGPGYKRGGKVHHKHHPRHPSHHDHAHHSHESSKERKRAHLHHLQREGLHETERALKKESHLRHGGHTKRYSHGGRIKDEHQAMLLPMHYHEESGMKRLKNGHHPETHQHETYRNEYTPKNIEGGQLTNLHIPTPRLNVESIKGAEMMHKGGHMHKQTHHKKHHHGGTIKKAAGGTVYEREMRGVHPSTHLTKINYEKDMKGVHPVHIPNMAGSSRKNPGALDESFGSVFKKGGKACKSGHKVKKMAAGGVGKIRHGAADRFGRPRMGKLKMGY